MVKFCWCKSSGWGCQIWQSLPRWQTFDVTSSLKASDNVWDKRAFSSLSTLKLLSSTDRGVWDKRIIDHVSGVFWQHLYPSYFPSLQFSLASVLLMQPLPSLPCVSHTCLQCCGFLIKPNQFPDVALTNLCQPEAGLHKNTGQDILNHQQQQTLLTNCFFTSARIRRNALHPTWRATAVP